MGALATAVPNTTGVATPDMLSANPTVAASTPTTPTQNYVTPPNIGNAGSPSGGTLTQGQALPNITTTQAQATAAPSWYTDYLNNISQQGTQAGTNAQYVGTQPMQQQAYDQTTANVGNYQPALTQAMNLVNQGSNMSASAVANPYIQSAASGSALNAAQPYLNEANQNAYSNVNNYMSPYVNDVVNQIGMLGQRQIQQNLSPGATAAAVGSGQFGSKRGAEVLGNTIRDANQNILATQGQALNTGYQSAMQANQADLARQAQLGSTAGQLSSVDLTRQLQAGSTAGQMTTADMANKLAAGQQYRDLASQTQNQGLSDVNALATMGGQQQTNAQNEQLFPLQVAAQQAGLLRGYTIPTSVSSTYTGPIPGAYSASPLQQVAGIGTLLGALNQGSGTAGTGPSAINNLLTGLGNAGGSAYDWLKNLNSTNSTSAVSTSPDLSGNYPVQTTDPGSPGYLDPNLNVNYPTNSG